MNHRAVAALLLAFCAGQAWGAGGLDTTFGTGGKVIIGGAFESKAAMQPDGRLLVASATVPAAANDGEIVVARFAADGSSDTTFGSGGQVHISNAAGVDSRNALRALALQADGRILISGCTTLKMYPDSSCVGLLLRLNGDGSVDSTFGSGGYAVDPSGIGAPIQALAIQADGGILGVGTGTSSSSPDTGGDFLVVRLKSTGVPDASFGNQGVRFIDWQKLSDAAFDVALQSDGGILVAGVVGAASAQGQDLRSEMAVLRLRSDGSIDPSFGVAGWWVYSPNSFSAATRRILVLPDDRILVAATGENDTWDDTDESGILRLSANGVLDLSYGQRPGTLPLRSFWDIDGVTPFIARPDGSALLVASYDTYSVFLAGFGPDGTQDLSVGPGGLVTINPVPIPVSVSASIGETDLLATAQNQVMIVGNAAATTNANSVGFFARYRSDDPPAGTVSIDSPSALQTGTPSATAAQIVQLTIHRAGGSQGEITVHYQTGDGTALGGQDYVALSGQLDWPDGDSTDRQIAVSVLSKAHPANTSVEFFVQLTPVQGSIALGASLVDLQITTASAAVAPAGASPVSLPASGLPASGGGGGMDVWDLALLLAMLKMLAKYPQGVPRSHLQGR